MSKYSSADTAPEEKPEPQAQEFHPVECAVNMLLARLAFDVLRNPEVKDRLIAHIHRKVNELRFPSYMHGIEVSSSTWSSFPYLFDRGPRGGEHAYSLFIHTKHTLRQYSGFSD